MTFEATERSAESGSPEELYTFGIGTEVFRYTTSENPLQFDGVTFSPLEIERATIIASDEQGLDSLSVTVPASTPLVRRYINVVPGQMATLRIQRLHRLDIDAEAVLIYSGLVRAVGFSLNGLGAEITVQPVTAGLSRTVPRMVYSGTCNHVLYDSRCKVNSASFRFDGNVGTVTGSDITVVGLSDAARPDGWANGGFVTAPGGVDFRLILNHVGDALSLLLPFTSVVGPGAGVQVFAGCAHDIETCKNKFDNVVNFGGFHWVPRENVFVKGLTQGS